MISNSLVMLMKATVSAFDVHHNIGTNPRPQSFSQPGSDCPPQSVVLTVDFGYPGALNDINIRNQSSLSQDFLDDSFTHHDFDIQVGAECFRKLWVMLDRI